MNFSTIRSIIPKISISSNKMKTKFLKTNKLHNIYEIIVVNIFNTSMVHYSVVSYLGIEEEVHASKYSES